ncbi:MAG: DUF6036 family nucleotidyltransferase [Solirubrobacteraceae bacterium]
MLDIAKPEDIQQLLSALAEQLAAAGDRRELVVVGGSPLLALGIIDRPTKDVDVVALLDAGLLRKADPLPPELLAARDRVSRDFGLPADWLNSGPAGLMDHGLPQGFIDRVETRSFGPGLAVHFASRLDQIHFKLYALVDQGVGKHEQDLRALDPTANELIQAARWTRTHDPPDGFRQMLEKALRYLGVEGADLGA